MKILGFYSKFMMFILGLAIFNGLVGMQMQEERARGFGSGSSSSSTLEAQQEEIEARRVRARMEEESDSDVVFLDDQIPQEAFIEQARMINEDIRHALLQAQDAFKFLPELNTDSKRCLFDIKNIDKAIEEVLEIINKRSIEEVEAGKNFVVIKDILLSNIQGALNAQKEATNKIKIATDAKTFLIKNFNQLKSQKNRAEVLFAQAMSRLQTSEQVVQRKSRESVEIANKALEPLDPSIFNLNALNVGDLGLISRCHLENSELEKVTGTLYSVAQEAKALFDEITAILENVEGLATTVEAIISEVNCLNYKILINIQEMENTPKRLYFERQDKLRKEREEQQRRLDESIRRSQEEHEKLLAENADLRARLDGNTQLKAAQKPGFFSRINLFGRKRDRSER